MIEDFLPEIILPGNYPGLNIDSVSADLSFSDLTLNVIEDVYESDFHQRSILFDHQI
jgi:hypothetical protein